MPAKACARPNIHAQAGRSVGWGRARARGQQGSEGSWRGCGGLPGLTARRSPEKRPADGPAPARKRGAPRAGTPPGWDGRRAPRGRGAGAGGQGQRGGLTHEEAKEVEADEQRPLAAALPRVVVERRAAAVLALRDDRLVVLVVLHGAGCGASLSPREDAPQ